eukprot:Pgem_evm1s9370
MASAISSVLSQECVIPPITQFSGVTGNNRRETVNVTGPGCYALSYIGSDGGSYNTAMKAFNLKGWPADTEISFAYGTACDSRYNLHRFCETEDRGSSVSNYHITGIRTWSISSFRVGPKTEHCSINAGGTGTVTPYCDIASWTNWGECDSTCGGGQQTRELKCNSPPFTNCSSVEYNSETRMCNEQACEIACGIAEGKNYGSNCNTDSVVVAGTACVSQTFSLTTSCEEKSIPLGKVNYNYNGEFARYEIEMMDGYRVTQVSVRFISSNGNEYTGSELSSSFPVNENDKQAGTTMTLEFNVGVDGE